MNRYDHARTEAQIRASAQYDEAATALRLILASVAMPLDTRAAVDAALDMMGDAFTEVGEPSTEALHALVAHVSEAPALPLPSPFTAIVGEA